MKGNRKIIKQLVVELNERKQNWKGDELLYMLTNFISFTMPTNFCKLQECSNPGKRTLEHAQ